MTYTYTSQPLPNDWKYGLFECCDSLPDCVFAYFLPPCYAGYATWEAEESFLHAVLQCLFYPFGMFCLRPIVREKRNIEGSILEDFLVVYCCTCCAAIQIRREFDDDYDYYQQPYPQYDQYQPYQQPIYQQPYSPTFPPSYQQNYYQ